MSALCIPLYGGVSYSGQSVLGLNLDSLLFPIADVQTSKKLLFLRAAFGQERSLGSPFRAHTQKHDRKYQNGRAEDDGGRERAYLIPTPFQSTPTAGTGIGRAAAHVSAVLTWF